MPFAEPEQKKDFSKFKKTEFLMLPEGTSIIRIVQPEARKKQTHYLNMSYVECLGADCPICKNNQQLRLEYPETYFSERGFSAKRRRYYVNVIDRTLAVTCPECGKEWKTTGPTQCSCGKSLIGVALAPINKIKVMANGPTLFEEDLNALEKLVLDADKNPVGIMNFDIALLVKGTGKDRTISAVPQQISELDIDTSKMEMYDLDKVLIHLEANEMLDLQRGVSLKDLFAAKRSKEKADTVVDSPKAPVISEEQQRDISERVGELFKQ